MTLPPWKFKPFSYARLSIKIITSGAGSRKYIRRWIQEREYGRLAAAKIREYQPEIVISANTPLDAQKSILSESCSLDARFIFWLQDFLGIGARSILRRRLPLLGNLIGRYYIEMEKTLLRKSDAIVAITEDFCPTLESWDISKDRIEVIPNWAPLEDLPTCHKDNPWSIDHDLHESFTFLYTGTLRMKHNPALLLQLAESVGHDIRSAQVVVASEGPGAEWLQAQARSSGLNNLKVLGFQPIERYAQVLASADVLVAILQKEAGAFSVPSKVLSYLCAKRPLLLAVPKENLAARIVEQNRAGIVVEPDDLEGFLQGARTLMASAHLRKEMGDNARKYAEATFDIRDIADHFETLLGSI